MAMDGFMEMVRCLWLTELRALSCRNLCFTNIRKTNERSKPYVTEIHNMDISCMGID